MKIFKINIYFTYILLWICQTHAQRFVIIIASYNNQLYYKQNVDSVFTQEYDDWRMIYIDDASSDGTGILVQEYIKQCKQEHRVSFIQNKKRLGHLANQYQAIHSCDNNEIMVILDGDDWLANNHVLEYLNRIYQDLNVWLTYGQFKELQADCLGYCQHIPNFVIEKNSVRFHQWVLGHLRTFYAGLFKKIKKDDLLYNGEFFPMAADVATMIPMAEMAGNRIRFINEILYIHNDANPLSLQQAWPMQTFLKKLIRNRPKYERLETLD